MPSIGSEQSAGNRFNLARLRAKTKVRNVLIREMLFADDAALIAHREEALQRVMSSFGHSCLQRVWSHNKSQEDQHLRTRRQQCRTLQIYDYTLEVVEELVYFGSTISSNLSLDTELDKRIGKAAIAMARLIKGVWDNAMLTTKNKMDVSKSCMLSNLL